MRESSIKFINYLTLPLMVVAFCCAASQAASISNGAENNQHQERISLTNLLSSLYSSSSSDAPKFYALNAQLYSNNNKQATSHRSSPDLRPLDGTRINPNDGTVNANNDDNDDDHESSIDSLIKSMKRRHMTAGSSNDGRSFAGADESDADGGPGARGVMMMDRETRRGAGASASEEGGLSADDEASIQRKSTKLTPADEEEEQTRVSNEAAPSRLRHSGKLKSPSLEGKFKRRGATRRLLPRINRLPTIRD